MRAMWTGNITFGLVHIPVKLYAATEDRDVRFHQVHLKDGGRIKYERRCQTCGEVVTFAEIGKGFEDETGRRVIVAEDELEALQVPHGRDVDIVQFAPADEIDPIHFDKAYYLEPATGAAKPYVLLRQALGAAEGTAIVMMSLRKRTRLALLRVRGEVIVLQTMLWPDEVRVPQFEGISDDDVTVRPTELKMAGALVEGLTADFDPAEYHDEYREAVLALLEQKLAGEDVIQPEEVPAADDTGNVVDLMAALQESVRRTQAARAAGGGESSGEVHAADDQAEDEEPSRSRSRAGRKSGGATKRAASSKRKTG